MRKVRKSPKSEQWGLDNSPVRLMDLDKWIGENIANQRMLSGDLECCCLFGNKAVLSIDGSRGSYVKSDKLPPASLESVSVCQSLKTKEIWQCGVRKKWAHQTSFLISTWGILSLQMGSYNHKSFSGIGHYSHVGTRPGLWFCTANLVYWWADWLFMEHCVHLIWRGLRTALALMRPVQIWSWTPSKAHKAPSDIRTWKKRFLMRVLEIAGTILRHWSSQVAYGRLVLTELLDVLCWRCVKSVFILCRQFVYMKQFLFLFFDRNTFDMNICT